MSATAAELAGAGAGARARRPSPGLAGTLSSLARLDAARATSPVPSGSPWWAAEAAELAERAGLPVRARAEARRALAKLLAQLDSIDISALPGKAARAAKAVAAIAAADEPAAAARLREAIGGGSGPAARLPVTAIRIRRGRRGRETREGPDARWTACSGCSTPAWYQMACSGTASRLTRICSVSHERAAGQVVVEAVLAPGADCGVLSRCLARLVDPAVRRVLAQAAFVEDRAGPGPRRAAAQVPAG